MFAVGGIILFVAYLVFIRIIGLLTVPDHGSIISTNYLTACNVSASSKEQSSPKDSCKKANLSSLLKSSGF